MTTLVTGDRRLSPKQAGAKLGVTRATLYRWAHAGILPPPSKFGPRASGWLESALDRWLAERGAQVRQPAPTA